MNNLNKYDLDIDGPTLREQRMLLMDIEIILEGGEAPLDNKSRVLLNGLFHLLDAIADQAHDK